MDAVTIGLAAGRAGADKFQRGAEIRVVGIALQDPGGFRPEFRSVCHNAAPVQAHLIPQSAGFRIPVPVFNAEDGAGRKFLIEQVDRVALGEIRAVADIIGIGIFHQLGIFADIAAVVRRVRCRNDAQNIGEEHTEAQQQCHNSLCHNVAPPFVRILSDQSSRAQASAGVREPSFWITLA